MASSGSAGEPGGVHARIWGATFFSPGRVCQAQVRDKELERVRQGKRFSLVFYHGVHASRASRLLFYPMPGQVDASLEPALLVACFSPPVWLKQLLLGSKCACLLALTLVYG